MEEALTLIDQLLEEHKRILKKTEAAERIASDVDAMLDLDRAKEDFVPGRPGEKQPAMKNLQDSLKEIEEGFQKHFSHEESSLLTVFEQYGSGVLASGLRVLLLEHEELLGRIAESRKEVAELLAAGLSREVMEGRAWGVRVYLGHTRKLLEAHAHSEQQLFSKLRSELAKA